MKKCQSILLIDDEPLVNILNRRIIENLGITEDIKCLSNGDEGLNYLRILSQVDLPPDMIFVDLNMPVMDGFEFLNEFQSLPGKFREKIKVIVLTSSISNHDYQTAQALGCDGYLIKPLSKEKILEEFKKVYAL